MTKTTTTQIAQAVDTMQALIASGAGIATRERQERLINNLRAKLANA